MIVFLHTRIRVSDLAKTIDFYTQLGFQLTRRMTSPMGNQLAYMSIAGSAHELELCWSSDYQVAVPEDLMHTAIGVDDIFAECSRLEAAGIEVWPDDWRTQFSQGRSRGSIAFVTDPDGYEVELIGN